MPYVIGGIAALAVLTIVLQAFLRASPAALARGLRVIGTVALLAAAAVLAIAERWSLAMPLAFAAIALWQARGIGRIRRGPTPGRHSVVRSAALEMMLDHDTGEMIGHVLTGTQAGKDLAALSLGELEALHAELAGDEESRALLEAYLDRREPGWREHVERDPAAGQARPAESGAMSLEQAYEILGLQPGATDEEIRAAHRRLMKGVHPDQGGSTFLAARINEAKDLLLGSHR